MPDLRRIPVKYELLKLVGQVVLGVAVVATLVFVAAQGFRNLHRHHERAAEVSPTTYSECAKLLKEHPDIADKVREVMSDGIMTYIEWHDVETTVPRNQLTRALSRPERE